MEQDAVYDFGQNFAIAANENASDTSQMIGYLILGIVGLIVIICLSVGGAYWFKKRSKNNYAQREREEIEFASAITSGMASGMGSGRGSRNTSGMPSGMPSGIATPGSVHGGTVDAKSTTKHPDVDVVNEEEVVYSIDNNDHEIHDIDDNSGLIVNDSITGRGKTQMHPLTIVAETKKDNTDKNDNNNDVEALAVIHGVRFEDDDNNENKEENTKNDDVEDDTYAEFGYETENDDVTSINNTGDGQDGHVGVRIPAINVGIDETVTYYGPDTTPKPPPNTARKDQPSKIGINMKGINELASGTNDGKRDRRDKYRRYVGGGIATGASTRASTRASAFASARASARQSAKASRVASPSPFGSPFSGGVTPTPQIANFETAAKNAGPMVMATPTGTEYDAPFASLMGSTKNYHKINQICHYQHMLLLLMMMMMMIVMKIKID